MVEITADEGIHIIDLRKKYAIRFGSFLLSKLKKRTSFVAIDGFELMKVNSFADEPPLCTEERKWWVFQKDKIVEGVVGK